MIGFFVYSMMVILNTNKLAIYILWAALYPYTFVPPAFFADTLLAFSRFLLMKTKKKKIEIFIHFFIFPPFQDSGHLQKS